MAKFHPADDELVGFMEGVLAPSQSLMVAAHCDVCPRCRNKVNSVTDVGAAIVFGKQSNLEINSLSMENMLQSIVNEPSTPCTTAHTEYLSTIDFQGRQYSVPKSLRRICSGKLSWSRIVGGLWLSPVVVGGKNLANFIYMEKDSIIPEHTHIGNEYTFVVEGSFSDEHSTYHSGDYISLNSDAVHTPKTSPKESCLVFTIIDEPLHFTSKWAKLVNPFSHLYFSVSTK